MSLPAQTPSRVPPNVNPADEAVAKMRANAQQMLERTREPTPHNREAEMLDRIKRLEEKLDSVLTSLNSATIDAVCNVDTTISVTLTLPGLPPAP